VRRFVRYVAPFAITTAALAWVFQRIGFAAVFDRLTPGALALTGQVLPVNAGFVFT